jgi:hypothetical protein
MNRPLDERRERRDPRRIEVERGGDRCQSGDDQRDESLRVQGA